MKTANNESKKRLLRVLNVFYIIGLCVYPLFILFAKGSDLGADWWRAPVYMFLLTCPVYASWIVTFPSIRYLSLREKSKAAPRSEMTLAVLCTVMPILSMFELLICFFSLLNPADEGVGILITIIVVVMEAVSAWQAVIFWGLPIASVLCGIAALILHRIVKKKESELCV